MRKLLDDAIAAEAGAKNDWFVAVFLGLIGDGNQQTLHRKKETHILTPPPNCWVSSMFPLFQGAIFWFKM